MNVSITSLTSVAMDVRICLVHLSALAGQDFGSLLMGRHALVSHHTVPSRDNLHFERVSIAFTRKVKCDLTQTCSNAIANAFERKAKRSTLRTRSNAKRLDLVANAFEQGKLPVLYDSNAIVTCLWNGTVLSLIMQLFSCVAMIVKRAFYWLLLSSR